MPDGENLVPLGARFEIESNQVSGIELEPTRVRRHIPTESDP